MVQLMGSDFKSISYGGEWMEGKKKLVSCPEKKCAVPFYIVVIINPPVCLLFLRLH